jgi:ketosteroid isomerase-like protein
MPEESATPDLQETIRWRIEAMNRGDFDAALAEYAPDAVWDASRIGMGVGVIEGVAAIRRLLIDFYRRFDDPKVEVTELHDLGNGIVFVLLTSEARIRGGEGVVTEHAAHIYESVDGLVVRVIDYRDIDEARAHAERLAEERG